MIHFFYKSDSYELFYFYPNSLLLVWHESVEFLLDRFGGRRDIQGVLDLLPQYPGMSAGFHANTLALARRKEMSALSYLGSR